MISHQKGTQFSPQALSQAATSGKLAQLSSRCCILFHQNSCHENSTRFFFQVDTGTNVASKSVRGILRKIHTICKVILIVINWMVTLWQFNCLLDCGGEGKHTTISQCSALSWSVLVRIRKTHKREKNETHLWTRSLLSLWLIFMWYFNQIVLEQLFQLLNFLLTFFCFLHSFLWNSNLHK